MLESTQSDYKALCARIHELESRNIAFDRSLAIIEFDMCGTILAANDKFLALLGYDRADVIGRHHRIFVSPEDRQSEEEYEIFWRELKKGRAVVAEFKRVRKDGSGIWIQGSYNPILDEQGAPYKVVKMVSDVTAARIVSADHAGQIAAISRSQATIEFALDGTILAANANFLDLMGYRHSEVVGSHHRMFVEPDEHQSQAYADFWERLRGGGYEAAEFKRRGKGGKEIWIQATYNPILDLEGRPRKIVKFATDVTARKFADADALGQIEAIGRTQAVIQFALDGTVIEANETFLAVMGFGRDEVVGRHHEMFISQSDRASLDYYRFWQNLRAGKPQMGEYKRFGKDGRVVHLQATYNPILDLNGMPAKIVKYATDITEREILRQRAEEANRQMMLAEEIAHVGHWRVDVRENRLTWSEEVYRMHGLDSSTFELNVESAIERYHPDDRPEVRRFVEDAISGQKPFEFKLRVIRPNGTLRHVISRGLCEIGQSGHLAAIFGTIMDVTELVDAERTLRLQSALLETTLNNMEEGLIKVMPDGTIAIANRRFIDLLDLPGNILNKTPPMFRDIISHLNHNGEIFESEVFDVTSGADCISFAIGTRAIFRPNGKVLEIRTAQVSSGAHVSTFTDVTARHRAEIAMRDNEARYRMLADATSDVITQLDLKLIHRYVSPACRTILGYAPDEMIGSALSVFIHPDDGLAVHAAMEKLAAGAVPDDKTMSTNRMRHRDGHWVWLEAGINLVRDPVTRAPSSIMCSLRDVTERQRTARQLIAAKAAADQGAIAKTSFVANMSHELRTPLTGILGIHDLLQQDPALDEGHRRLVGLASASGRSLLNIVNDILDFSKIEAGQLAIESVPFDLHTLVETCRVLGSQGLKGKPVDITTRFEPTASGWFIGDSNRLQQVLMNLLTNAVKFTERGAVTIDVGYGSESGMLSIAVTDTGVGIPNAKLPLLFERFTQADASTARRHGGTGLGLAISRQLVELMGGRIRAQSEPGEGSCFSFGLPLKPLEEGVGSGSPANTDLLQSGAYRILLAEDNIINKEIIGAMLTRRGHSVSVVSDGAAAAAARRTGPPFDLILMDIQMPGMDGLTATGVIRREEQSKSKTRIPIIGLTANAMAEDVQHCLAAGMDGHVAKPIDWPKLLAAIDRVMSQADPRSSCLSPKAGSQRQHSRSSEIDVPEPMMGHARVSEMLDV